MHAASSSRRALTLLFARYIAGQIADAQWEAFSSTFDAAGLDPDSRAALAAFYNDAVAEEEVRMPTVQEVEDLLPVIQGHA